jgi:chaperonin GroEL (HSP60 family)
MRFLAGITDVLLELYTYLQRPADQRSLDSEQQLAMRIVRKASDEQARREITGA